jgi:hypothetical protein
MESLLEEERRDRRESTSLNAPFIRSDFLIKSTLSIFGFSANFLTMSHGRSGESFLWGYAARTASQMSGAIQV